MKAVLDTNVFISGVISTGVTHEVLVRGFRGEFDIVVSIATLAGFEETLLTYPEKVHMDEADVHREVETERYFAEFIEPDEAISEGAEDTNVDTFLEAAVAGNEDSAVSGDRHLPDLGSFRGIEIIDPRPFHNASNREKFAIRIAAHSSPPQPYPIANA